MTLVHLQHGRSSATLAVPAADEPKLVKYYLFPLVLCSRPEATISGLPAVPQPPVVYYSHCSHQLHTV